jgi:uncharacterized protein YjiS (DUF1127 family)
MPPQQTDPAFQSGSDTAVLGPGLAMVLVKAADEALTGNNAVGMTAVPTRHVVSSLKQYWRAFQRWRRRLSSRTALHDLSDRALNDIGVRRDEIAHMAPHRAIDALRGSTTYLWIESRGVM